MTYIQAQDENIIVYDVDDDGAIIYDSKTETTHVLNETAYYIYKTLKCPADVSALFDHMITDYDLSEITPESVASDILMCLNELMSKGLIRVIADEEN